LDFEAREDGMGVLRMEPKGVVGFGEVTIDAPPDARQDQPAGFVVSLGRWRIEVPTDFDPNEVEKLLACIARLPCG
jgi:hypothetical protein